MREHFVSPADAQPGDRFHLAEGCIHSDGEVVAVIPVENAVGKLGHRVIWMDDHGALMTTTWSSFGENARRTAAGDGIVRTVERYALISRLHRAATATCGRCGMGHRPSPVGDGWEHGTDPVEPGSEVYAPPEPCDAAEIWKVVVEYGERPRPAFRPAPSAAPEGVTRG